MDAPEEEAKAAAAADEAKPVTPRVVRREVQDFLRAHEQRRRQLPRAIVVGTLAGLVAVAFRGALNIVEPLRAQVVTAAGSRPPLGLVLSVLIGVVCTTLAVWLVKRFAPEAGGSGIQHIKAVLHNLRTMAWRRIIAVKFVGGVLGIGSGLALGREGPTIQMGGAIGDMVSRWFSCTARERRTLIAAGAGAGLSAAFNAPLAGLVFVLEEVQRDFAPAVFAMSLLASVMADATTRLLLGQLPVFHVGETTIPPLGALPVSISLGAVAGLLGVAFNRGLLGSLNLMQRIATLRSWGPGLVVGTAVGIVGWFAPQTIGSGSRLVEETLQGSVATSHLPMLFGVRFGLTMLSYGCGAPGGIFAPLLVLGSEIGLFVGDVAHRMFPTAVFHPATFAVVGMAAYFSAIVRAPLTGVVLMVEMTGNYSLILPLLAASLTAYGVADLLGDRPIYEALLERDLLRGEETPKFEKTLLLDYTIEPGAPFEGKRVRELGLPPGCVLLLLRRGVKEEVPTADARLHAGDQITAVVAPGAARAIPLLKNGTHAG
jgi:CIC family chloride channel protein